MRDTCRNLKDFFEWLSREPGYKSRVDFRDAQYFKLSEKDTRVALAKRSKPVPTIEQIERAISLMPATTPIERRDRALMAFVFLTGARDRAVISFKLKHIDLQSKAVCQDAREVKTKYAKTFLTAFFPVGSEINEIVASWVNYLLLDLKWGNEDPLFPKSSSRFSRVDAGRTIEIVREHWATTEPVRRIFKSAFEAAGLPYFNPHSFRNTLVRLGESRCRTPEEFKAWSQNLGHQGVLTTLYSYGEVPEYRQKELILGLENAPAKSDMADLLRMVKMFQAKEFS